MAKTTTTREGDGYAVLLGDERVGYVVKGGGIWSATSVTRHAETGRAYTFTAGTKRSAVEGLVERFTAASA